MPDRRVQDRLADMRDNIALANRFVEGLTLPVFVADRRTFYAVTRCLEIVSQAARKLPDALRERQPGLPRRAIMGVGKIHRHDYDNVSEQLVWRTVHDYLPELLAAVNHELAVIEAGG